MSHTSTHCTKRAFLFAAWLAAGLTFSSLASAQEPQPATNETVFSYGLRYTTGFFHDSEPPKKSNSDKAPAKYIPISGLQLQFALQQYFIPEFALAGEFYVGGVYTAGNTLSRTGWQKGSLNASLGFDLVARYYPLGQKEGPVIGASVGAQWIFMPIHTYTSFAPTIRLGWSFNIASHTLLVETGYLTPFVAGISADLNSDNSNQKKTSDPSSIRMHQFFLAFNIAY